MEPTTSAPDPLASTSIVWVGLLLISFAINFTAVVVALYVWSARPERPDEGRTPIGYVLVVVAAAVLVLATVLEVAGVFLVPSSKLETFSVRATLGQLPIAFAVFAYAIYRRRPPSRDHST